MIKLREKRQEVGLTQSELARLVNWADPTVDQTIISALERGNLYPDARLRDALCMALQCTEEDLYDGVEAMFVPSTPKEYSETTRFIAEIFAENSGKISRVMLRPLIAAKIGREVSDRTMRSYLEEARQEGFVIANDQDGDGYYIPETIDELHRLEKQNQNRAISIMRQQKHIRAKIRAKEVGNEE